MLISSSLREENESSMTEGTIPQTIEEILDHKSGVLLIVPINKDLQFTVSQHTDAEIFRARHVNELRPSSSTYVRIDAAQRGLGTGSCGPQTLPKYCVNGGSYQITFLIKHMCNK